MPGGKPGESTADESTHAGDRRHRHSTVGRAGGKPFPHQDWSFYVCEGCELIQWTGSPVKWHESTGFGLRNVELHRFCSVECRALYRGNDPVLAATTQTRLASLE